MQAFLALLMIEKVWGGDNLERYQPDSSSPVTLSSLPESIRRLTAIGLS